uniref:Uncharacterized protein n=1 Tax=Anguilla anguilla TaxID=7936 RepID=A0A0E9WAE5_ANGAN
MFKTPDGTMVFTIHTSLIPALIPKHQWIPFSKRSLNEPTSPPFVSD